jgi:hypothetical protein
MLYIVLGNHLAKYVKSRGNKTQMTLNFQNIFHQIRAFKIRILLTSLSIVFFLYLGIVIGYFYYLSS